MHGSTVRPLGSNLEIIECVHPEVHRPGKDCPVDAGKYLAARQVDSQPVGVAWVRLEIDFDGHYFVTISTIAPICRACSMLRLALACLPMPIVMAPSQGIAVTA